MCICVYHFREGTIRLALRSPFVNYYISQPYDYQSITSNNWSDNSAIDQRWFISFNFRSNCVCIEMYLNFCDSEMLRWASLTGPNRISRGNVRAPLFIKREAHSNLSCLCACVPCVCVRVRMRVCRVCYIVCIHICVRLYACNCNPFMNSSLSPPPPPIPLYVHSISIYLLPPHPAHTSRF